MLRSNIILVQYINRSLKKILSLNDWLAEIIYTGFLCCWQFSFRDQKFLVGSRCATSNAIQNSMPWKLLNKGHHHKKQQSNLILNSRCDLVAEKPEKEGEKKDSAGCSQLS